MFCAKPITTWKPATYSHIRNVTCSLSAFYSLNIYIYVCVIVLWHTETHQQTPTSWVVTHVGDFLLVGFFLQVRECLQTWEVACWGVFGFELPKYNGLQSSNGSYPCLYRLNDSILSSYSTSETYEVRQPLLIRGQ